MMSAAAFVVGFNPAWLGGTERFPNRLAIKNPGRPTSDLDFRGVGWGGRVKRETVCVVAGLWAVITTRVRCQCFLNRFYRQVQFQFVVRQANKAKLLIAPRSHRATLSTLRHNPGANLNFTGGHVVYPK
jgi:prepilin-type processing-associated H-X9-DG protein